MKSPRRALAAIAVISRCVLVITTSTASASGRGGPGGHHGAKERYTFAVIGDIPHGDAQLTAFPWADGNQSTRCLRSCRSADR